MASSTFSENSSSGILSKIKSGSLIEMELLMLQSCSLTLAEELGLAGTF